MFFVCFYLIRDDPGARLSRTQPERVGTDRISTFFVDFCGFVQRFIDFGDLAQVEKRDLISILSDLVPRFGPRAWAAPWAPGGSREGPGRGPGGLRARAPGLGCDPPPRMDL